MTQSQIRDLIYFDFDKAASIWSQFEGGLRERVSVSEDTSKDESAGVSLGIPKIAEARLGLERTASQSVLESKLLHHDLLNKVEEQLTQTGLVVDLGEEVQPSETYAETIRAAIGTKPYLKAAGWSVFEDYRQILSITERFNELLDFISKCSLQAIKQTPEYLELQQQIDEARQDIKNLTDRNQKAVARSRLKALEANLEQVATPELYAIEQWLLDGLKLWINTFVPNRINFRIYPFESCPSFQVICNLKRECFVDQDLEHVLYGYGKRPNVLLAVFGLITSLPAEAGHPFNPMAEFEEMLDIPDKVAFEKAFRDVFGAMDQFEDWMRYSRYPNVTVHPIAVFREFQE